MAAGTKDKIPPHDDETERAVLGALLLDDGAVTTVMQYLRPGDFYSNANGKIFGAIISLADRGIKADLLVLTRELIQLGILDEAGGADYVASLTHIVSSSANVEYYAQIIQNHSLRRALLRVSSELATRVFDESLESRTILEEAQQLIFDLSDRRQTYTYKSVKEIAFNAMKVIEELFFSRKDFIGITTGFDALDEMTLGFQPADFVIIGARPSMGKTALALNMAANAAIRKKIPTAFFTLEMTSMSLMMRLISSEAAVESNAIRTGRMDNDQARQVIDSLGKIADAPLYVVDMPNMRLMDLRSQARQLRANRQVEIIFIDYITMIALDNNRLQPHEQIAEISRSLKGLARELNIPVVALSQLTREAEQGRPNLANIRASGAIEQDADMVMFIHRERELDKNKKDDENRSRDEGIKTELILSKNRNGRTGTVDLMFLPKHTKFVPMTKGNYN
jgi:replicative DNA helicase